MAVTAWITRDAKSVLIKDMTDSHLQNAIAYLERYRQDLLQDAVANGYRILAFVQGEQASYDIEQGINQLSDMDALEYIKQREDYKALKAEFRRRGGK